MADQVSEVREALGEVGAAAVMRADEIEQGGSLPADLFDDLVATGFFRSLYPKVYGGYEFALADVNDMLIQGARADGSLGWLMMIGVSGPMLLGLLPKETVDELLADGVDIRARGTVAPKGTAVPVDGGYVISGQWPFASGGPSPDFVAGNCVVLDGGAPRIGPLGIPDTVLGLMPADDVEFLDTWRVVGLKGTDSADFVARDVFVPEKLTVNVFVAENCFDTPVCRLPIRVALATGHASVAIGIAQGALDDIAGLSATKRAAMNPGARLAEDPVFRHFLGEQALRLVAARAFLDRMTENACNAAASGRALSPIEAVEGRTMAGYITAECVKVVDAAYTLAGSTSLYESSLLQRRLRDIHVTTQHVAATSEGYRTLGALLAGEEVSAMELF